MRSLDWWCPIADEICLFSQTVLFKFNLRTNYGCSVFPNDEDASWEAYVKLIESNCHHPLEQSANRRSKPIFKLGFDLIRLLDYYTVQANISSFTRRMRFCYGKPPLNAIPLNGCFCVDSVVVASRWNQRIAILHSNCSLENRVCGFDGFHFWIWNRIDSTGACVAGLLRFVVFSLRKGMCASRTKCTPFA